MRCFSIAGAHSDDIVHVLGAITKGGVIRVILYTAYVVCELIFHLIPGLLWDRVLIGQSFQYIWLLCFYICLFRGERYWKRIVCLCYDRPCD